MQIKAFKALCPKTEAVESPSEFFTAIKEKFNAFRQAGFYHQLSDSSFYIHQIVKPERELIGLVVCIDLQAYLDGTIVPHEDTIQVLEDKQINLLKRTNAQLKPVMLAHRKVEDLQQLLGQVILSTPHLQEITFAELHETHTFWQVPSGKLSEAIQEVFEKQVNRMFVADGHHRLSGNASLFRNHGEKFRWLPAALYAEDQLQIFEFNRIVKGLKRQTPREFISKLSGLFHITSIDHPAKPIKAGELTMGLGRNWYHLKWKNSSLVDNSNNQMLDVARLNTEVLEGILGITDIRSDKRVQYVEGIIPIDILVKACKECTDKVAFCLPPLSLETFFELSDRREILPPKSTWFEPRLRSGILVRQLD